MKEFVKYSAIFAVAVVVIGTGIFFMRGSSDSDSANKTDTNSTQSESPLEQAGIINSPDGPYTVTMKITDSDGVNVKGTMKIESDSRVQMAFKSKSETVDTIFYDDSYYLRADGSEWIKYSDPSLAAGTESYVDVAKLDDETINQIKESKKLSEEPCGNETCSVYEVTANGATSKVYVGNASKRVQKTTGSSPETGTFELTYDYDSEFTITPPADAKEITLPSTEGLQ